MSKSKSVLLTVIGEVKDSKLQIQLDIPIRLEEGLLKTPRVIFKLTSEWSQSDWEVPKKRHKWTKLNGLNERHFVKTRQITWLLGKKSAMAMKNE